MVCYRRLLVACLAVLEQATAALTPGTTGHRRRVESLKSRALAQYHRHRQAAWTQCSDQPQSVIASPTANRFSDSALGGSESRTVLGPGRGRRATVGYGALSTDTAVYLSTSRGQWNGHEKSIPDHVFSASLWVKPDGGQPSPAIILEARDLCIPFPDRGWTVGMHNPETAGERDLRLFVTLHSWSKVQGTTLTSPLPLAAGQWTHFALTFDGEVARFYQNGAQVAVTDEQGTSPPVSPACRTMWIGGDGDHHYRGQLDDLRVWNTSLDAPSVRMLANGKTSASSVQVRPKVQEDFAKLDGWSWMGGGEPRSSDAPAQSLYSTPVLVSSDAPSGLSPLQAKRNPCGFGICDSPEVIQAYSEHWTLRKLKVLRYRVVVVSDDDGSNPTVTKEQIRKQHEYLLKSFKPYNITWELEETIIRNSSLRRRVILLGCTSSMVGNGQCDQECRHPSTGNDGGDCGRSPSFKRNNYLRFDGSEYDGGDLDSSQCYDDGLVGNGVCDEVCNDATHGWDGGDCCQEDESPHCYDPSSPNRSYMDAKELKLLLKLKNTRHINVLFAQWTNKDVLGVATFPWEKNIFSEIGGVVLQPSSYGVPGQMSTLVHELGHSLGLWHVHRGVSEMDCTHACYEREASMLHGDLCGDTKPTPQNEHCQDPPAESMSACGTSEYSDTPYANYMGYADDYCVEEFTHHQMSRMHCHVDLVYSTVLVKNRYHLPPPPLLLTALSTSSSSTVLSWIPVLAMKSLYDTNVCSYCSDVLEYSQYAYRAESSDVGTATTGVWLPDEATGPPDAESCQLSYKMWLPDLGRCRHHVCTLTAYFETAVVPSLLQLWVTWNAQNGIKNVELVFEDGSSGVLSNLPAQCDTPLTVPLSYNKPVAKVHIRTTSRFVGIDAVKLVSSPSNPMCSPCKPVKYKITRDPPFQNGRTADADHPIFIDSDVEEGKMYSYSVKAYLGPRFSESSPVLYLIAGSPICGDGKVDRAEECDDGGLVDGDGCSAKCTVEKGFHCKGQPCSCYWHEGDGVCEDFEKRTCPQDCGFYTPPGFEDQWAYDVRAGPIESTASCTPVSVIGPPQLPLSCYRGQISEASWSPCGFSDRNYWLSAIFREPAVATSIHLYLTSDGGSSLFDKTSKTKLRLLDPDGQVHHEQEFQFTCNGSNPQVIPIYKDLSGAFVKTGSVNITFTVPDVSIAAVRLRSWAFLAPLEVMECRSGQQYHTGLRRCDTFCTMDPCPLLGAKHASLNCTGREDGDVCFATCHPGYRSHDDDGPSRLVCRAGSWAGPEPSCKPVDCAMPLIAHADAVCPDGTSYGKTCSYKCRPPARFVGGGNGLATVTCEANGRWSSPSLVCQVNCPPPSASPTSVIASTRCRKAGSFTYGQSCRFRCKGGFHVEGQSTRKRILYLRCDQTASWVGPKCVPVTCPAIDIPHNCTSANEAGSECTVACPTQQPTGNIHRCELDGAWNPAIPLCLSFPVCQSPQSKDKNVVFACEGNHVGAICKTSCVLRDYEPMKPNVPSERVKIKCKANGEWSPAAEDIICVKKCFPKHIADGYCDADNNQEHCDWDGGDCCPSTVPGGAVMPFPDDCGEPCTCKDPSVIENVDSVNGTIS